MDTARIPSARAIAKVVVIALLVIAAAFLLTIIVLHVRTTLRWLLVAIFLTFILHPAVDLVERARIRGRKPPRWAAVLAVYAALTAFLAFLVLQVIPPIVSEGESLGTRVPGFISDAEDWAEKNEDFRKLNDKYDLTSTLSKEASDLPSHLGDAAKSVGSVTVTLIRDLVAAVTVLAITFFLLLDGKRLSNVALDRFTPSAAERTRRIVGRVYGVIRSYVTINLVLAGAAGVFTWLVLEVLGVELAISMAVIVAFLDLIPLIGLTLGGVLVAIVASFHSFPVALIVWVVLFLVYQQLQDRVVQPLLYGNAVHINPVIAIVALLIGAELLGILGALLAVPVAASIGVILDELLPDRGTGTEDDQASPAEGPDDGDAQPEPAGG